MITAIQKDNEVKWFSEDLPKSYAKENDWICPLCKEPLSYVKEGSDGTMAHFRHQSAAEHPKISEGENHRKGKKLFRHLLTNYRYSRRIGDFEFEKIIRPKISEESCEKLFDRKYEVADIAFEYGDEKCIIEIQSSSQGWREFKLRTLYYNIHGYSVLWILDKDLLNTDKNGRFISNDYFYNLKNAYDGRLYFFDADKESVFTGKFDGFSSKTRASRLRINCLNRDDLGSYVSLGKIKFGAGGFGDSFRFNESYSSLKNGSKISESRNVRFSK